MKYIYYPGCSLKGTARAYEESLLPVLDELKVQYEELKDWNCCGATAYMSVNETKAFALAARNLAMAEDIGSGEPGVPPTIMAPCNACYLVLSKAKHYIEENRQLGRTIKRALKAGDLDYRGTALVRHPLDILVNDVGLDKIKAAAKKPLKGLKVACYYGCQIVRPYADFDDQFNPMSMDKIIKALGGEPVEYPLKTRCCGGSLTGTIPEVGVRLNYVLLKEAKRRGADVVATACPLCQFNLECYQDKMNESFEPVKIAVGGYQPIKMPVSYFTQLMGLALGIPTEKLGFNHTFVEPALALAK